MFEALILIIEDDPEIVDILRGYLEREGFRTVSASDGQTGLIFHQQLKPDLILLDVKMPVLDGYGVLAALRRTSDTPVMMLTALAEDLDKLQALRIGADDYVVKPFNPLEVVARARAILRRSQGAKPEQNIRIGRLTVDPVSYTAVVDEVSGARPIDLTSVLVVDAEGNAVSTPVQLGELITGEYMITDGLKAGDTVIVEGQDRIPGGGPVNPVPFEPMAVSGT